MARTEPTLSQEHQTMTQAPAGGAPAPGSPIAAALWHGCEVLLAGGALVLLAPVLALLMAAVRADSTGPALFRQIRVGRGGRSFTIYKLRTMTFGVPDRPTHEMPASTLTRIGGFLRRSKLDELPQLYNVVRGDMSLVGPRPCLPSQTALIEGRRAAGALDVRPGITGLAQVMGVDMSDVPRLVAIDGRYVTTRSVPGDWRIILATFGGRGR